MKQSSFSFLKNYKKEFGGALLLNKRKSKRPLSTKNPIHLVLKSCQTGLFSPGNRSLEKLIRLQAQKFNIRIYDLSLNWSHIHCVIKLQHKEDYIKFIRALTSVMAQRILKIKPELGKIFRLRPYTRILSWGRDFKNALSYQIINQLEAWGFLKRHKKKSKSPKKSKKPPN